MTTKKIKIRRWTPQKMIEYIESEIENGNLIVKNKEEFILVIILSFYKKF